MDITAALENIKFFKENKFMLEEIECIRENKTEAVPVLLEYINYARENAEELDPDYFGHLYAMFLLAEFGVRDAFEPIIKYLELPDSMAYDIMDDSLCDDICGILAPIAVYEDIDLRIKPIIENKSLCWDNRMSAVNILLVMYNAGKYPLDELEEYFTDLIGKCVEDETEDNEFISFLAISCLDIYAETTFPFIEKLFDADRIDKMFIGDKNDFLKTIKSTDKNSELKRLRENRIYQPVTDTVKSMQWWACFKEEPEEPEEPERKSYEPFPELMPIQAKSDKIGRNEPCPCGSGKKYKKCCGR